MTANKPGPTTSAKVLAINYCDRGVNTEAHVRVQITVENSSNSDLLLIKNVISAEESFASSLDDLAHGRFEEHWVAHWVKGPAEPATDEELRSSVLVVRRGEKAVSTMTVNVLATDGPVPSHGGVLTSGRHYMNVKVEGWDSTEQAGLRLQRMYPSAGTLGKFVTLGPLSLDVAVPKARVKCREDHFEDTPFALAAN